MIFYNIFIIKKYNKQDIIKLMTTYNPEFNSNLCQIKIDEV